MCRPIIRIAVLLMSLTPCYAQITRHNIPQIPRNARRWKPQPRLEANSVRLPASATSAVIPAPCPPEAQGAACGFVKVPLDRDHPNLTKIAIYFQIYPHSSPGPAESAIIVNFGGPGISMTRGFGGFVPQLAQFVYAANMDVHDLLLIDNRGTGLSSDIDCEPLQHGTKPFVQSVKDCAQQLGDAASFFGRADNAKDIEAVRSALGYDKVDYHGGSYGGLDVAAYATRFGEHLRSIILDAPSGTPVLEPFAFQRFETNKDPAMVKLDCMRSPTCSPDHPNPILEFDLLVNAIRLHPVEGNGHDPGGNLVSVRVDEAALLNYLVGNINDGFVNTGELLAAGVALAKGDSAPLLRLGAETISPLETDSGDPTDRSIGARYAIGCVDTKQVWDWSDPVPRRSEQYDEAVSQLPFGFFAPFSKTAATGLAFSLFGKRCLTWQNPHPPDPVVPPHAIYPTVPVLVLDGDLDNGVPLEETSKVASFFPHSTSVTIPGAGHETVFWSQCAANLMSTFVETLQVADTSCANAPETVWPAVGRFPLVAGDARPAMVDSHGSNQIGLSERKVVTVAVATAIDALQRVLIGSGDGVGLRGGTFHTDFSDTAFTTTLTNCSFTKDVIVSGTVIWNIGTDDSFVADLAVSGPGTSGGTLHVQGFWRAPGSVGNFSVSGNLGNKQVVALVPEA